VNSARQEASVMVATNREDSIGTIGVAVVIPIVNAASAISRIAISFFFMVLSSLISIRFLFLVLSC